MAEITAALVKELREVSGAGMMDCKKALTENNGDLEAAVDWLRKKGIAGAAKKAGRVAAEGLVAVVGEGKKAVLVEVNSETDFVARNDKFQDFVSSVAKLALNAADIEALKSTKTPEGPTVAEKLTQLVATIGENMNLRRMASVSVKDGVVATYMHNATVPNMGKIGVLVALESAGDKEKLAALGKQIAMHVAAANPSALDIQSVSAADLDRERAVLSEQARASGKPEEIIAKMVEGRLRKYYEDVVLLEQLYVIDGESRVKQVIEKASKELGAPVKVTGFVRFALGEGIQREEQAAAE
ncbi:MAG TPA: translation elongation factor Ts [Candidatus Cybelea sp.]|nr:translation elongation factor Ts [Candidatus Cybelea sp.]